MNLAPDALPTKGPPRLEAREVSVGRGPRALLAPVSVCVRGGEVVAVQGPPGAGHVTLALLLGGRMSPSGGEVVVHDDLGPAVTGLQRAVALIDVPGVTTPDGAVPLRTILGEELAMSRRRAGRSALAQSLVELGAADHARTPWDDVPADLRLRSLVALAADRPGVHFLVLCLPERHGVPLARVVDTVRGAAAEGIGVVVTVTDAVETRDLTTYHLRTTIAHDAEAVQR